MISNLFQQEAHDVIPRGNVLMLGSTTCTNDNLKNKAGAAGNRAYLSQFINAYSILWLCQNLQMFSRPSRQPEKLQAEESALVPTV